MITGFLCISYSAKNNYEENKVHTNFVGRVDRGQEKSESGLTLNLHVLSLWAFTQEICWSHKLSTSGSSWFLRSMLSGAPCLYICVLKWHRCLYRTVILLDEIRYYTLHYTSVTAVQYYSVGERIVRVETLSNKFMDADRWHSQIGFHCHDLLPNWTIGFLVDLVTTTIPLHVLVADQNWPLNISKTCSLIGQVKLLQRENEVWTSHLVTLVLKSMQVRSDCLMHTNPSNQFGSSSALCASPLPVHLIGPESQRATKRT